MEYGGSGDDDIPRFEQRKTDIYEDGVTYRNVLVVNASFRNLLTMIRYGRPAFYDAKAPQGQWAQWSQTEQPGAKSICWLCSVDGQILASAGNDWADGAESEANPLDYILLAKEIIKFLITGYQLHTYLRSVAAVGRGTARPIRENG